MSNISSVFEYIATNGVWKSDGSTISGSGSTVDANKPRNKFLGDFIKDYNITQVVDIPCGDCTWQHGIPGLDKIRYFGADISKTALTLAKEKNKTRPHMSFSDQPFDLILDIPKLTDKDSTLIIIKEVIQHLTLEQGVKMLQNAQQSGARYIAVTNHDAPTFNVHANVNITTGGFYPSNIYMPPFNFKNPIRDIADTIGAKLNREYGNLIIFNLQDQTL